MYKEQQITHANISLNFVKHLLESKKYYTHFLEIMKINESCKSTHYLFLNSQKDLNAPPLLNINR